MNELALRIDDDRTVYQPGDLLQGSAAWTLDKAPRQIELRLYWKTTGKGSSDVAIVDSVRLGGALPEAQGRQTFQFRLPLQPYSFAGRLISLVWGLELVVGKGRESSRLEIVIAPGGRPVVLHAADGPLA